METDIKKLKKDVDNLENKNNAEENTQLKEKLSNLEEAILTLEQEKADMVQKLSQAKQEGVKLDKESEERRYNEISEIRIENDKKLKELTEKYEKEYDVLQNKLLKVRIINLKLILYNFAKKMQEKENASKLTEKENEVTKRIEEIK
uniref:Uncharacterized protein n=1 Tax=Meloidogyne javanica TaxID=6303 RepID=A0A915M330_MELJA